jgi:outer membrane lipoprotein LolB
MSICSVQTLRAVPLRRHSADMYRVRYLTPWLLLTLVAGCAGLKQPSTHPESWLQHRQQLVLLDHWVIRGKLALRTAEVSESASLLWQQSDQDSHLQLSGPLGVGTTVVDSNGQQLEIRRGEELTVLDISTPEAMVLNTGWDLPLRALTHWLKGLPSPDLDTQLLELDPQTDLLHTLQQDDWLIRYEQYRQFQTHTLPTRLRIQRDTTQIKVIISDWQTPLN